MASLETERFQRYEKFSISIISKIAIIFGMLVKIRQKQHTVKNR